MFVRNVSLALIVGLNVLTFSTLKANDYYDQEENCDSSDGAYEEYVDTECLRKRQFFRGHYYDEQDPTDELEKDTAWPGRNEEFSDQLFTPNGGPWP